MARPSTVEGADRFVGRGLPAIRIGEGPGAFASIPRRSCIAEAQASGEVLWEMKKTAARDAWNEIQPSIAKVAAIVTAKEVCDGPQQ